MVVHCVDEKTWLTKLKRIGKLAASDKDIVFNNIGHIINIEMLQGIYQELDGQKAIGIDGVTKEVYGKNLDENLKSALLRIRKGTYVPKAARIVQIPKEDGSFRPLAISCFEDKLVQSAVNKILCTIFESIFLPCSFGFRPKLGCHEALRSLQQHTYRNQDGAIVEIDLRKYFNSIPHTGLEECLRKKISDKRFLKLINILVKSKVIEDEQETINTIGCPQGSIISPILSNIYLHYVIDVWFAEIGKTHMYGRTAEVRYADDMVFIFQNKQDAERFYKVLPKRLNKFGLALHLDKSQLIESGKKAAARAEKNGTCLPVYKFLGFMCYWGKAREDFWRLKFASRNDRIRAKLKGLHKYLKENLNTKHTNGLLTKVKQVVRGWINYHAISDNAGCVWTFVNKCRYILLKWFNRRGGKRRMNWERLTAILKAIKFPETWKTQSMFTSEPKHAKANRSIGSRMR
jgi:group II intron reverse transcriptase/maturase